MLAEVDGDPNFADLERAATLVGLAFDPAVDVAGSLGAVGRWLDGLAAGCPAAMDDLLATVLGRHDLRGNTDDYYDPANSMLHRMAGLGRGIPISLSVVVKLAGQRVGVPVDLMGLPGHVMVRCGEEWGDPFAGPGVLTTREALGRWRQVTGQDPTRLRGEHLRAMTNRAVVVRMLNNLTAEYARRDDRFALSTAVQIRQAMPEYAAERDQWRSWQASWN